MAKRSQIKDRTGEIKINSQGLEMKITKYRKYSDIDVKFNDGYIKEHSDYGSFKKGLIRNPNFKHNLIKNRVGEVNFNNQGLEMKIIKYNSSDDMEVKFLNDNYIKQNVTYNSFKNGEVNNPNFKRSNFRNKIGEKGINNFGSKMIIVGYREYSDIDVYFSQYNWTFYHASYKAFKNGSIKCPYEPRVCNYGYVGEGKYLLSKDSKNTKCYKVWNSMLRRCYSEKFHKEEPTYKDCTVCDEWLNFQNFAEWYYNNYYEIEGETIALDKDILLKGNKVYSPQNCVFVPEKINTLFIKCNKSRGKYILGVHKKDKKFIAQYSIYDFEIKKFKKVYLGSYNTPEEAFNVYKEFKERYIKEVADYYKEQIPQKLYDAMYRYEVEITD